MSGHDRGPAGSQAPRAGLILDGVTAGYGSAPVLHGVDLEARPGEEWPITWFGLLRCPIHSSSGRSWFQLTDDFVP